MELYNLDKYLEEITINASIKGLSELYQKYIDEAKNVDLKYQFSDYSMRNKFFVSLRIELPSHSSNSSDVGYIVLNYASTGVSISKNKEIDKIIVNNNSYESVLRKNKCKQIRFILRSRGVRQVDFVKLSADSRSTEKNPTKIFEYFFRSHEVRQVDKNISSATYQELEKSRVDIFGNDTKVDKFDKKALKDYSERIINTVFGEGDYDDLYFGFYAMESYHDNDAGIKQLSYILVVSDVDDDILTTTKSLESEIKEGIIRKAYEILLRIRNKHINNLSELVKRETVKSAISAIMSRNMSHNLGSHFISNTRNYFSALVECDLHNSDPKKKKNYHGIKHALQYIQERMDFIATITSTDTYPFGAVNAKTQIFDELTPDDVYGNRPGQESYNFLMDYLVLSEKISKQSWGGDGALLSTGEHKMLLQIGHWDGADEPFYWDSKRKEDERDEILGINFAIPGGILGRHAIFSIVENIIRNAAKHGQDKIKGDFVVKMLYRTDRHSLIVFDNKKDENIKGTVKKMEDKLRNLRFLTSENALEQENKGLKEMLICAIWLQNENVTQVMIDNDYETDKDKKLENFRKYLEIVAVDEDGKKIEEVNDDTTGCLGYSFKLDQYERVHYLEREELNPKGLNSIKADIVCYKEDCKIGEKRLSEIFPRFLVLSSEDEIKNIDETEVLKRVVEKNCGGEVLQRKMVVASTTEYKENSDVVSLNKWDFNGDAFLFKGHAGKSKWDKFSSLFLTKGFENKYVDSISGGDFTFNLVQPSFVDDVYNLLKIKESVVTRFVIIDERIFEHYKSRVTMTSAKGQKIIEGLKKVRAKYSGEELVEKIAAYVFKSNKAMGNVIYDKNHIQELKEFVRDSDALSVFLEKDIEQHFLDRKGVFIFNLETVDNGFNIVDLSSNEIEVSWNTIKDEFEKKDLYFKDATKTFLSVHLGLIDKIREQLLEKEGNKEKGDIIDEEIVKVLKNVFGAQFVSIHSGRGGFDIRESLKQFTFQSFSSIENPLYNSKFLLAQQFYNLNYYGATNV